MKHEHIVKEIEPFSIADELGIEPGDKLISINDNEIEDVFDYHYYVNDEELVLLIEKPDGEQWELEIEKDYEDASLEEWLAHNRETEKELAIALKENGYSVEASEEKVTLTDRDINMILRKAVIYNPDGSIANYSESLFFQLGASQKYSIQYKCVDGVGYDESFDFIDFVDNNFKLIK